MTRSPVQRALEDLCFAVMPLRDCLHGDKRDRFIAALAQATRTLAGRSVAPEQGRGTSRQRCAVAVHRAALDLALAMGVPGAELSPHFNNRIESGDGPLTPELAMARLHEALAAAAADHLETETGSGS